MSHRWRWQYMFMMLALKVTKEMNCFAPGCLRAIAAHESMHLKTWSLGEWASAGSQWETEGDEGNGDAPWAPTDPDTCSQPAAGAAERRWGTNAVNWLWTSNPNIILLKLCAKILLNILYAKCSCQKLNTVCVCLCIRAGTSGKCPVWAEQRNSPGGSADGAQRAGGQKRGDAATSCWTSPCITVNMNITSMCSTISVLYTRLYYWLSLSMMQWCVSSILTTLWPHSVSGLA